MATATNNNTARTRASAGKKAAATRKRNAAKRSQSARKAAATRAEAERTYIEGLAIQAERAVLIPVGAALVARDSVVETVLETAKGMSAEEPTESAAAEASEQEAKQEEAAEDRDQGEEAEQSEEEGS